MRILKVLLFVAGSLTGCVILAVVAAGLLIPAERSFTNTVEINAPGDTVWRVINDRNRYPEWQTNLAKVEVVDDKNWVEYPRDSPEPLKFTVGKDDRPNSMAFEYKMGGSFEGNWRGYMTPTSTGVRLETVDSYVTKGWLTKILIYTFFDYDKFAKDWNNRLKQRVENQDQ